LIQSQIAQDNLPLFVQTLQKSKKLKQLEAENERLESENKKYKKELDIEDISKFELYFLFSLSNLSFSASNCFNFFDCSFEPSFENRLLIMKD
jgi:hypothetical protein